MKITLLLKMMKSNYNIKSLLLDLTSVKNIISCKIVKSMRHKQSHDLGIIIIFIKIKIINEPPLLLLGSTFIINEPEPP